MKKAQTFAVAILAIAVSMGTVGIAQAFNPQPDPPGATGYEFGKDEINAYLTNISDDLATDVSCVMQVNVIVYASQGQTVAQKRVDLGPGESEKVVLSGDVDDELRRLGLDREEVLVRLKVNIREDQNAEDSAACEDAVIGRLEVRTRGFKCRLCAPVKVKVCIRAPACTPLR